MAQVIDSEAMFEICESKQRLNAKDDLLEKHVV